VPKRAQKFYGGPEPGVKIIVGPSTPEAPCAGAHVCLGGVDHTRRGAVIPDGIHGARQLDAHWPGAAVNVR